MGNCATKPKVLKDSEDDLKPVERETTTTTAPVEKTKIPAEKSESIVIASNVTEKSDENKTLNAEEEAAAAARWNEKGKEIMVEEDDVDELNKRQSLSLLFHETKPVEKEVSNVSPTKPETNNKTVASSEVLKIDDDISDVKAPETFDVQTRNDLEVKISKDPEVKTPETPKAKEAEKQDGNYSENWDVKFPEELEAKKPSQVSKLPEVSEISAPDQLSNNTKVTKESSVVPEVRTDEVKAAESELLKVSEVKSSDDLEIKVPQVFEAKTPVTDVSEVKTDQETLKVKAGQEETEGLEFVDAQEKIDKSDQDKETVLPKKTEKEEEDEEEYLSFEKKVKETTLSGFGNK